jgi:hypothetical protein
VISTILSRDDSIAATQHYFVTDSVEPPPVHVRRVQQMPMCDIRPRPDDGIVDTKQLRREVQNSRLKPIVWPQTSCVGAPAPIEISDDICAPSDQIIQDITEPIKAGDSVRGTHMISTARQSWNGKMKMCRTN